MTEHIELARADAADAILTHPLIAEALDNYEQELIEAWKNSRNGAQDDREKLHQMHQAAAHFRAYLQQVVTTGKLIRAKVRPPTLAERATDRVRALTGRR